MTSETPVSDVAKAARAFASGSHERITPSRHAGQQTPESHLKAVAQTRRLGVAGRGARRRGVAPRPGRGHGGHARPDRAAVRPARRTARRRADPAAASPPGRPGGAPGRRAEATVRHLGRGEDDQACGCDRHAAGRSERGPGAGSRICRRGAGTRRGAPRRRRAPARPSGARAAEDGCGGGRRRVARHSAVAAAVGGAARRAAGVRARVLGRRHRRAAALVRRRLRREDGGRRDARGRCRDRRRSRGRRDVRLRGGRCTRRRAVPHLPARSGTGPGGGVRHRSRRRHRSPDASRLVFRCRLRRRRRSGVPDGRAEARGAHVAVRHHHRRGTRRSPNACAGSGRTRGGAGC